MFFNWTEYNIKKSVLWSDTSVKQNMILKIAIRFCYKDLFVLKMSEYYQYVYLEIILSCYQHESNYFLLVQNRHTQKGSDVQWMVHRNQHIVVALHLVVSMNVWLLYDLNGVEPKRLLLF